MRRRASRSTAGCADSTPQGELPQIVRRTCARCRPTSARRRRSALIKAHRLPWEALPTEANADPDVWAAMLPSLGLTALVRNLGNMTRIGAIAPLSAAEALVVARLGDEAAIAKSRLHPFAILQAMRVYAAGRSVRGAERWTPSRPVLDALDGAFYKAFANVEPTGKRHLIGLDVSGSMGIAFIGSVLSARDASAALALVTMAVEQQVHVVGFTVGRSRLAPFRRPVRRRQQRADAACDLAAAAADRRDRGRVAICRSAAPTARFRCSTRWRSGSRSMSSRSSPTTRPGPVRCIRSRRCGATGKKTGIAAKLIVVGMTSTGFSIADPNDAGMLDVVGFDAAAPAVMADFAR